MAPQNSPHLLHTEPVTINISRTKNVEKRRKVPFRVRLTNTFRLRKISIRPTTSAISAKHQHLSCHALSLQSELVFPRESHFVIPGKAGMQILFPGNSRDPGNLFFLIKLEKGHILRNKMQY
jgi:hypothetical protein